MYYYQDTKYYWIKEEREGKNKDIEVGCAEELIDSV